MAHNSIRTFIKTTFSIVLLFIFCSTALSAQERFDLQRQGGHYYFTSSINDIPVEIMLESGIPALLVGQSVYEACLQSDGLTFQPSSQKIRLLNRLYDILCKADGEIMIGGVIYDGPVFVLKDYDGASVPMQYLKDPASKRAVLAIDLKNNYMQVGGVEKIPGGRKFRLSFDESLGFPLVAASARLITHEGRSKLKGRLIVDFGNPSLLFLRKQHKSIGQAIEKGTIKLRDAYDKKGNLVAQGIYADQVSLFGQKYHDVSIGVTDKMQSLPHMGFLGIPFFSSPVVFDFDRGYMMVSR